MPIEITMPRLSDTMESGTIIKWNVSEGDEVSAGETIADIETDKATMEMQVYDDGRVARILVDEGATVDIGTVIALLAEEDEEVGDVEPAPSESSDDAPAQVVAQTVEAAEPVSTVREVEEPRTDDRMRISPLARRLADEHGIDLKMIAGSGPGGRIIKRDVMQAIETGQETAASIAPAARTPVQATPVEVSEPEAPSGAVLSRFEGRMIPLSNMRQTIARRLVESKSTIPHYQVTYAFNMDPILELRKGLNEQLAGQGVKLSVNDFLVRACALAMYENPEFNASWADDHLVVHGEINIGIAISLPRERGGGLVVGTIRNADAKGLRMISAESKYLAEKARGRGLSVEEMADATFTLSNLGMFGVEHFTAIINPPNSAILAVGAAAQKPVVRGGELTVGHEMSATLSSDHRVIDGAMAAEYLATLREYIESPAGLLV